MRSCLWCRTHRQPCARRDAARRGACNLRPSLLGAKAPQHDDRSCGNVSMYKHFVVLRCVGAPVSACLRHVVPKTTSLATGGRGGTGKGDRGSCKYVGSLYHPRVAPRCLTSVSGVPFPLRTHHPPPAFRWRAGGVPVVRAEARDDQGEPAPQDGAAPGARVAAGQAGGLAARPPRAVAGEGKDLFVCGFMLVYLLVYSLVCCLCVC